MIEYSKYSLACWLAVRYMQNALLRIDEAGKKGRSKPLDAFVTESWANTDGPVQFRVASLELSVFTRRN